MKYFTRCVVMETLMVNPKEYKQGLSAETANAAAAEVESVIKAEAKNGWVLHSINEITKPIIRKKTIWEFIFGWIPIIGAWIFPNLSETKMAIQVPMYMITFVAEG